MRTTVAIEYRDASDVQRARAEEIMEEKASAYALLHVPADVKLVDSLAAWEGHSWPSTIAEVLKEAIRRLAPQVHGELLVAADDEGAAIFFHDRGMPFSLVVGWKKIEGAGDADSFYPEVTLVAPVRPTLSPVAARPQTFGDDMRGLLRLHREVTFDDDAFDPLYLVSGEEDALRDFFTADVRAAFVTIAAKKPADIAVGDGLARMTLKLQTVAQACAFLVALKG